MFAIVIGIVTVTAQQAHKLQTPLKYDFDKFQDIQGAKYLTKEELSYMYFTEHKSFTQSIARLKDWAYKQLKKDDTLHWEMKVKELDINKKGHANWEFFWEGLYDRANFPFKSNGVCQYLIDQYQVKDIQSTMCLGNQYTKMQKSIQELTGMNPKKYGYGTRAQALKNHGYDGWIWLLWNSYTNSTEVRLTKGQDSYLFGEGNGLLHPLFVMDRYLASTTKFHMIVNWEKVQERLDTYKQGKEYVLITGGLGYIGSHTIVELINKNNVNVLIVDNLDNSKITSMNRMKEITGKPQNFVFQQVDLRNQSALEELVFKPYKGQIKSVIHFAALKAVGQSISQPLEYYDNNVGSTIKMLQLMRDYKVNTMVFSSSATVYGDNPISDEFATIQPINPYGQTKAMMEQIMKDYAASNPEEITMIALRYFNPIGAHQSGLIGEDPNDIPNNLMPYIQKVASGHLPHLNIYGNDYETKDGTGIRDYIHITDLAQGHVAALDKEDKLKGFHVFNLGTGSGTSVIEMKDAFEKASGLTIKYEIKPRRAGDSTMVVGIPAKANNILEWKTQLTVQEACRDAWNWVKKNPNGY